MVNATIFINFLVNAGIIDVAVAQAAGVPAGISFFRVIGFDAATAQLLTTQLFSMPVTQPKRGTPPQGPQPRGGTPGGPASPGTAIPPATAPANVALTPTGYPVVPGR